MPICSIIIISKNKQSLFNFLFYLFNNLKINFITKYKKRKKKKKIITVLKSPHVNKKAQEQFEFRSFSKQFLLPFYNTFKYLLILKKIKTKLFPDIKLKIKFLISNKNSLRIKSYSFNPNNYTLGIYKLNKISQKIRKLPGNNINLKLIKKTKNYVKILDCFGELQL